MNAMMALAQKTDFSEEELEKGRLFYASPLAFVLGVASLSGLPDPVSSEIAFLGRSNVGKSSLFNALCGRHDLARTSKTPGRTRQLNFFQDPKTPVALVDMPGYGYAQVDKKQHKQWQSLIFDYLRGRVCLRRVFVLIDSRRGVMKGDLPVLDMLDEAAVTYQVVLTKADKLSGEGQRRRILETVEAFKKRPAAHPRLHLTSAEKQTGLSLLRAEIADFLP